MPARSAVFAAAAALALVLGFALGRAGDDADRVAVTRTGETVRDALPQHLNWTWVPAQILGSARPRVEFAGAWRLGDEPALIAVAWRGEGDKTSLVDSNCERQPSLVDGMLVVSEPIGDCPHQLGSVHCYGGHRNHFLAGTA